jgi:integrase/recombinase XerD
MQGRKRSDPEEPRDRSVHNELEAVPALTARKLGRVRTFFRFCIESDWIDKNPARLLNPPTAQPKPRLPFTDEKVEKILWATEIYPDRPKGRRALVKTFVLLLRYSGLRIRDAVTLRRSHIVGGKLLLDTAKTGQRVYVPLPDVVLEALRSIKNVDGDYFFWSGHGNPKSAITDWQRSLKRLFAVAGIKGHAHRFRNTFTVSLHKRISLENVSGLLGHQSTRITEKHYAPWVKSRQESFEREVKKAWE